MVTTFQLHSYPFRSYGKFQTFNPALVFSMTWATQGLPAKSQPLAQKKALDYFDNFKDFFRMAFQEMGVKTKFTFHSVTAQCLGHLWFQITEKLYFITFVWEISRLSIWYSTELINLTEFWPKHGRNWSFLYIVGWFQTYKITWQQITEFLWLLFFTQSP
jgi:hypothetical protein